VKGRQATALTPSEEITLRRLAHGQSDVGRLCAADLARLQALYLIDAARVPSLTDAGWRRFERLAKPVPLASFDAESELTAVVERLTGTGTRRGISSSPAGEGAMRIGQRRPPKTS
jgi:hypothetical protein